MSYALLNRFFSGKYLAPSIVLILSACLLLPFANKAFHIDDTLFIRAAEHIRTNPVDPYGFDVNWSGTKAGMWEITKNPPLAAYYLAAAASITGWSEGGLHIAMLLPAMAVALGTFFLAARLSRHPLLATTAGLLTPVFLVSGTTIMCDVLMLALWVWGLLAWIKGLDRSDGRLLLLSGFLMAAAVLTKYYGIALVPLAALYALALRRPLKEWLIPLTVPLLLLVGYNLATHALYGKALFLDAGIFSAETRSWQNLPGMKTLTALIFSGGCLATFIFYAPLLWPRHTLLISVLLPAVVIPPAIWLLPDKLSGSGSPLFLLQAYLMAGAGFGLLSLALADYRRQKDADSLLLLAWIMGTFLFTALFNWSVNGRTILPMAPAAGILLVRRLTSRGFTARNAWWPLFPAAVLSFMLARADYNLAGSAAAAANAIAQHYSAGDRKLWFQGNWGFQYYMEKAGATALDGARSRPEPGDIIVVPDNNTVSFDLPGELLVPLEIIALKPCRRLTTMSPELKAGFYSDVWGMLPFAFGPVPEERYFIVAVKDRLPAGRTLAGYGRKR